jgi:hypothetical protein
MRLGRPVPRGFGAGEADASRPVGTLIVSLVVGKKLGVFELSGLVGVGGMGEVYRAWHAKLGVSRGRTAQARRATVMRHRRPNEQWHIH